MAWYSTGTVAVTNGSKTVTGTGTAWYGGLQQGWGLVGPDGRAYEIATVVTGTAITLKTNYQGATASGQTYTAFPTMSLANEIVDRLNTLIGNFQGVVDGPGSGKFHSGTVAAPGVRFEGDDDTGMRRASANDVALVAGGVDQIKLSGGKASGAAVQFDRSDTGEDKKIVTVEGALAASLSRFGAYYGSTSGENVDDLEAGFAGIVSKANDGTWPEDMASTFGYIQVQKMYKDDALIQTLTDGYDSTNPTEGRVYTRIKANSGGAWGPWTRGLSMTHDAQENQLDTGADKLMKVGAFGLGVDTTSMPLLKDGAATSGGAITQFFNTTPSDIPVEWGHINGGNAGGWIVNRRSRPVAFVFGNAAELQVSRYVGPDGWTAPSKFYHERSILGTVSQSGGIPTGAVIERGTNANGEYVRFADGTQICTLRLAMGNVMKNGSGTDSNPYRTDSVDGSWPASFVSDPSLATHALPPLDNFSTTQTHALVHVRRVSTGSYFGASIIRPAGQSTTDVSFTLLLTATGRWF